MGFYSDIEKHVTDKDEIYLVFSTRNPKERTIHSPAEVKDGLCTTSVFVVKKYNVRMEENLCTTVETWISTTERPETNICTVSSCLALFPNLIHLLITLYESVDGGKAISGLKVELMW